MEKATMNGKKVGQLNAAWPKSQDLISALIYDSKVILQPRAC